MPSPEAIKFINRVGAPRKGRGKQLRSITNERVRLHQQRLVRLERIKANHAS